MENSNNQTKENVTTILTPDELLKHWQGHRTLTRRVIELFPEKEFFTYKIGGMRTFAEMTIEEKNKISHRGIATRNMIDLLRSHQIIPNSQENA